MVYIKNSSPGTSLVVWWLRPWVPNAEELDSIARKGARSHLLQLSVGMP